MPILAPVTQVLTYLPRFLGLYMLGRQAKLFGSGFAIPGPIPVTYQTRFFT